MMLTTLMIVLTLALGKDTLETTFMLLLDLFLTIAIILDVAFRIKMMGARNYFSHKWNVLECGISLCCAITFIFLIFRKKKFFNFLANTIDLQLMNEFLEEIFFFIWAIIQYIRIVLFLHKQH